MCARCSQQTFVPRQECTPTAASEPWSCSATLVTDVGGGASPTTAEPHPSLFSNSFSTSENRLSTPTLGTIKYFTRQAFFLTSSFVPTPPPLKECLLSVSGESFVLLNRHGVQGKKMNPTLHECIHKEFLGARINMSFLSIHIGPRTTLKTFMYIFTYIHVHLHTHIHTFTHR